MVAGTLASAFACGLATADPASWISPGSGNWLDATNWSTDPFYPTNGNPSGVHYDVTIQGTPDLTVSLPLASVEIDSLTLDGARVDISGASRLYVENDINLNGVLSLSGSRGVGLRNTISNILGTGTVLMESQATHGGVFELSSGTTTIGSGITIRTGSGSGAITNPNARIINDGTISVETPGEFLSIFAQTFTNNGQLKLSAGTLVLGYSYTPQTLGSLTITGGNLVHTGTMSLGGGSFSTDTYGGTWVLDGRVINGTLHSSQTVLIGGSSFGFQSVLFDRVTLDTNARVQPSGVLQFQGGLTLADTILDVEGRLFATGPEQTLGGTGTIRLAHGASIDQFSDLTAPNWIVGQNVTIDATGASANLTGVHNQGTIVIDDPAQRFTLDGPWHNGGTIVLSDGRLRLGGSFGLHAIGHLERTGGIVAISGTLRNQSTTLYTDGYLAPLVLESGTILGGSISGSTPITVEGNAGMIGVNSLAAPVDITRASLRIHEGITLAGSLITLRWSNLRVADGGLIGGSGTILVDGAGDVSRIGPDQSQDVVTIGAGVTIRSGPQLTNLDLSNAINHGRLLIDTPGSTFLMNGATFDNHGEVRVTDGATVRFGTTAIRNGGSINIDGGSFFSAGSLSSSFINSIVVNNASMTIGGAVANGGSTLAARSGADWEFSRGTVFGGRIAIEPGVIARAGYLSRFDGVTVAGELLVPETLEIVNDLNLDDARLVLLEPTTGAYAQLHFPGPGVSFRGTGVIEFAGAAEPGINNYGGRLLIDPGITIKTAGGDGVIGQIDQEIENRGTIRAETPLRRIRVYAPKLINAGTLAVAPDARMRIDARLENTGIIEMDGTLILDYFNPSPIDEVIAQVRSGYADGAWTGTGITSPAARAAAASQHPTGIGIAEATDLFNAFPAVFRGQVIDSTTVLLQYTLYGDANLDGVVNLKDFNILAANFGQTGRRWTQGDFTYGGAVTLLDFNLLAANFGYQASGPNVTPEDWANLSARVPEPAGTLVLLGAAGVGLLSRGARRARPAAADPMRGAGF